MKEQIQLADQMIEEGEKLQKYFYLEKENKNKLKSYSYKLQGAIKRNNINEYRKLFIAFYGGMGKPIPNTEAVKKLFKESQLEEFKTLGNAYIYGLEKIVDKKEEGGNNNEK